MFNIYYLNFNKMHEISMLIDNEVTGKKIKEQSDVEERLRQLNATYSSGVANINPTAKDIRSKSSKIIEEIEVKHTKSVYLKRLYERCKEIDNINEVSIGKLIKVKNTRLSIENDENMQIASMISKGIFKDMQVDGYNIDNIVNPLFRDYSYLIKGSLKNSDEEIIIKVPMLSVNEFENLYSLYDILIGEVTIIGIYKGKISDKELNSTFNFIMQSTSDSNDNTSNSIVDQSSENNSKVSYIATNQQNDVEKKYHYIDLIAITQDILFEGNKENTNKKISLLGKIKNIFRRRNNNEENIYI